MDKELYSKEVWLKLKFQGLHRYSNPDIHVHFRLDVEVGAPGTCSFFSSISNRWTATFLITNCFGETSSMLSFVHGLTCLSTYRSLLYPVSAKMARSCMTWSFERYLQLCQSQSDCWPSLAIEVQRWKSLALVGGGFHQGLMPTKNPLFISSNCNSRKLLSNG